MTEAEALAALTAVLVTVAVAAIILKVSQDTIRYWVEAGTLEGVIIQTPGAKHRTFRVKSSSVRKIAGLEEVTP